MRGKDDRGTKPPAFARFLQNARRAAPVNLHRSLENKARRG
jgi:hypothetical protein